jgi:hypothetical protein
MSNCRRIVQQMSSRVHVELLPDVARRRRTAGSCSSSTYVPQHNRLARGDDQVGLRRQRDVVERQPNLIGEGVAGATSRSAGVAEGDWSA